MVAYVRGSEGRPDYTRLRLGLGISLSPRHSHAYESKARRIQSLKDASGSDLSTSLHARSYTRRRQGWTLV